MEVKKKYSSQLILGFFCQNCICSERLLGICRYVAFTAETKRKLRVIACIKRSPRSFARYNLSAQTKCLDDGTIALDVAVVEIVKQGTAFSYQLGQ